MNLFESLLQAQNGGGIEQLGRQFGVSNAQTEAALRQLVPALSGGIRRNVSEPGGLDDLVGALKRQDHERYYDDPRALEDQNTVADGNAILGHILGSKDVSRQVAARAAETSGVDSSILKKMLPVVAAMVMGSLSKGMGQSGGVQPGAGAGDMGDLLTSFLDADKDGSVIDDLLGMAGRFLR